MRASRVLACSLALFGCFGSRAIADVDVAPPSAAAMTRMLSPLPPIQGYLLRGVVGKAISVALPVQSGYSWHWQSDGLLTLFAPPYQMRFMPDGNDKLAPEVWTFPLLRPGKTVITFHLLPNSGPVPPKGAERRLVTLVVLTPYEAQQHPPDDLDDMVLLK